MVLIAGVQKNDGNVGVVNYFSELYLLAGLGCDGKRPVFVVLPMENRLVVM